MVATADGWRPIEQVVGAAIPEFVVLNPVRVWTPHGIAVASHTYSSGVVPTIKVRTARGYEIEGTPDHRVMGADGEWRVLGALQGGDRLLLCPAGFAEQRVRLQVPLWHGRRPGAVPSSDPMLLPSVDITPRWAEFLGLFVGDGSLASNTVKVTVARQDPDLIEWVLAFGRDLGLRAKVSGKHGWGHRTVGAVDVRFSSRPMQDFLDQLGLVERTSRNRRKRLVVPECILRSPRDVVAGFLRGLFEADASVTRRATGILMTTKSPTLAAQVHLLLLGFGIPALRRTIWNRQYEREYQQVVLRRAETDVFAREVGLLSVRRQAALRKITERPHSNAYRPLMFEDEVKATVLGQGVVYDLHVPGVEAYYSGGFLSHNSALKAIEYGAVCTPTIATDSVTYRPFVRHGENGFLCKDTRDWLRALTVLATDHSKRIEMGLRARADAETMDIAQHVHKWEEVLMEVIARKRREVGMPALAPVQA